MDQRRRESACEELLEYFGPGCRDEEAIAALSEALADSGERYNWPAGVRPLANLVSTGGPASLSTLLCPYIVAAAGFYVPNLTVPGSVAGAVDVLRLIGGYSIGLDHPEMLRALRKSKVAHTLTSSTVAPADGFLFSMRKQRGKKSVAALVIASVLSKKLASSVDHCVVDVRCGRLGNLGGTPTECIRNAELLVRVAERLRIRVRCVVTDVTQPQMPYLGRSESLYALVTVLARHPTDDWMTHHIKTCTQIASAVLAVADESANNRPSARAQDALETGGAEEVFHQNLVAQGASAAALQETLREYERANRVPIPTPTSGYVTSVDCGTLAGLIISVNKGDADEAGLRCLKPTGAKVRLGDPVIELRHKTDLPRDLVEHLSKEAVKAYRVAQRPQGHFPPQILATIG